MCRAKLLSKSRVPRRRSSAGGDVDAALFRDSFELGDGELVVVVARRPRLLGQVRRARRCCGVLAQTGATNRVHDLAALETAADVHAVRTGQLLQLAHREGAEAECRWLHDVSKRHLLFV